MHLLGDVDAPALDPLGALEPARRDLRLAAVAGRAAPGHGVGLQNRRLDAVFLGQDEWRRKARCSPSRPPPHRRPYPRTGPSSSGGATGGADPIGRRIVAVVARPGVDQWDRSAGHSSLLASAWVLLRRTPLRSPLRRRAEQIPKPCYLRLSVLLPSSPNPVSRHWSGPTLAGCCAFVNPPRNFCLSTRVVVPGQAIF